MNISVGDFLGAAALLLSIVVALKNFSQSSDENIKTLEGRITALETKVEVFWRNVSIDVALLLHKPHPDFRKRDELIEKYAADKLTETELKEFILLLEKLKEEGEDKQERFYASYILHAIKARYNFV